MRLNKAFWIWGQFSKNDTDYLNKLKNKVQNELYSPIFDVHITLNGPYLENDKVFLEKLRIFCHNKSGIKIKLKSFAYKNEFFESFYISILNSQELFILRKEICQLNNFEFQKKYEPHISLAYGDYSEYKKINLISKLPKIKDSVKIEKISLVDVNEKLNQWNIINSFSLK